MDEELKEKRKKKNEKWKKMNKNGWKQKTKATNLKNEWKF